MIGSYFSSRGSQIVQAAAGLGRTGFVEASAGLGAPRVPCLPGSYRDASGRCVRRRLAPPRAARSALFGMGDVTPQLVDAGGPIMANTPVAILPGPSAAETPSVVVDDGGMIPSSADPWQSYRDGIFAIGPAMVDYGQLQTPWHDGVFGGSIGADVTGPVLDLRKASIMRQFKMALRSLMQSLPVAELDNPQWDDTTEMQWRSFLAMSAQMPNANVATIAKWNMKDANGRDFPTVEGASALLNAATMSIGANGPAYAAQYWPDLTAWQNAYASTHSGSIMMPEPGWSTADMLTFGVGAAAAAALAWFLFGRKRG